MNLIPCENALVRLQSASKVQLQAVKHYFARRDLEAHLATLLDAARGHESHSVPAGSPQYLVLHQQAERLNNAYCQRWQVTPDQLNAELPALGRLRQLAQNRTCFWARQQSPSKDALGANEFRTSPVVGC